MAAFADAMDRLGPFEPAPALAVAVSGGADSLALLCLAAAWAGARGGRVLALTVDHRLRPESAGEAARVAGWCRARGIDHRVLVRDGPAPTAGIMAAARAARLDLLAGACRSAGILHLLLGHHLDDLAETVAMRRARGRDGDGLAGIPAVRELEGLRLLRPLLTVAKAALEADLRAAGIAWLDDPTNRDPRFERTRHRLALSGDPGATAALVDAARRAGPARAAAEGAAAALAARAARIDPAGWVALDPAGLAGAPAALVRRLVAGALACVGGRPYPPRGDRLDRLMAALATPTPWRRTLAGCRVVAGTDRLLVLREPAAAAPEARFDAAGRACWDGRFRVVADPPEAGAGRHVAALGEAPWRAALPPADAARVALQPGAARPALPAVWDGRRLVAVPEFLSSSPDCGSAWASDGAGAAGPTFRAVFVPTRPLVPGPYPVV